MDVKSFHCPNCGSALEIPPNVSQFFCTFCGSQIHADDGIIRFDITNRIIDEAKLKQLELQEQQRIREEQAQREQERLTEQTRQTDRKKRKRWWIITGIWNLIGSIGVTVALWSVVLYGDNEITSLNDKAMSFVMNSLLFVPAILAALMPKKNNSSGKPLTLIDRIGMYFAIMFGSTFAQVLIARIILFIAQAIIK